MRRYLFRSAPLYTSEYMVVHTVYQAKTLIYINVKSGDTEIYGNTFFNCNSHDWLDIP